MHRDDATAAAAAAPDAPSRPLPSPATVATIRRLAFLLDDAFGIPGTRVRFGLDPIIGLVPVVGDTATLVMGLLPVIAAVRFRLGPRLVARMLGNLAFDWLVGLVPGIDLVLDAAVKAHRRNAILLEREVARRGGGVDPAGGPDPGAA